MLRPGGWLFGVGWGITSFAVTSHKVSDFSDLEMFRDFYRWCKTRAPFQHCDWLFLECLHFNFIVLYFKNKYRCFCHCCRTKRQYRRYFYSIRRGNRLFMRLDSIRKLKEMLLNAKSEHDDHSEMFVHGWSDVGAVSEQSRRHVVRMYVVLE